MTSAAWAVVSTMQIVRVDARATAAGESATAAPRSRSGETFAASTSWTTSEKPRATRLSAIGRPMLPSPMNPTALAIALSLLHPAPGAVRPARRVERVRRLWLLPDRESLAVVCQDSAVRGDGLHDQLALDRAALDVLVIVDVDQALSGDGGIYHHLETQPAEQFLDVRRRVLSRLRRAPLVRRPRRTGCRGRATLFDRGRSSGWRSSGHSS